MTDADRAARGNSGRSSIWCVCIALGALLVGCGGGGSSEPLTALETPTAYTSGPITGFGSVSEAQEVKPKAETRASRKTDKLRFMPGT